MALLNFCLTVLLAKPMVVELSAWIGVAGCWCPNFCYVCCIGIAILAFRYSAAYSTFAAKVTTKQIIFVVFRIAPYGVCD